MKRLVIYYSLEGHTEKIAKRIASNLEADIMEIQPVKPIKAKGKFGQILGAAGLKLFNKTPKIKPWDKDLNNYDELIIASPVWMGGPVQYFNTFFKDNKISGKKIHTFFSCGSDPGNGLNQIKGFIPDNEFMAAGYISDKEKDSKAREAKVVEFCETLKKA